MKKQTIFWSPAHSAGVVLLIAAGAAYFVDPGLAVALLFFYIILCVLGCFFPQMNFLGPVVSRGQFGKMDVALTFDDGPSAVTTPKILDLLDHYQAKATFFVTGENAVKYPNLIYEIIRRGHSIGNHSLSHDPLVMLKGYRTLYREVAKAQSILQNMGIHSRVFRPPVGIVNPKLFPILSKLELLCVTFSCRAGDAGNFRVRGLAGRILKKVKINDIVLLHDRPTRRPEDDAIFWPELEKILKGLADKGLRIRPLSELIGKTVMDVEPQTAKKIFD